MGDNNKIFQWFDSRFKIKSLVEYMGEKVVPRHGHSVFYYFGGISLFLFIVQVITGILLLMYYRPGADSAYESVQFIITNVSFGWLIRAIHSWSANLMVFFVFLHMFTVYFTHAYRKPRELTWLSGMGLLGLALAFGFSTYVSQVRWASSFRGRSHRGYDRTLFRPSRCHSTGNFYRFIVHAPYIDTASGHERAA